MLDDLDPSYDPAARLLLRPFAGPGYHSTVPDGTPSHPTRESMDYALRCLAAGGPARVERAAAVIECVCGLQDVDPTSATYGIWSWVLEEPLDRMSPPDWNWADFIGARLAQAIALHEPALPADTANAARAALGHAAWSIFRRNSPASYTNIAIMGAVVTAAAGELLGVPALLAYARRRLSNVEASVAHHGSFAEYNSPAYTPVAIDELDRLHLLVSDPDCRAAADRLHRHAWEVIADHFHPATQQWAGPHGRAYADLLRPDTAAWLSEATGVPVTPRGGKPPTRGHARLVPVRPCPADLRPRFARLGRSPAVIERQFFRRAAPPHTVGTTWLAEDACLGSMNRDFTWTQRRSLIGYWTLPGDAVATFKLQVLLNGRDFPGEFTWQRQDGPRLLGIVHPLSGTGDFHPTLNVTPGSRFDASDLRVRYVLHAPGATADRTTHAFRLSTATRAVAVHPSPASAFDGRQVEWAAHVADGLAAVDAVLYAGPARTFDFTTVTLQLAAGVALLEPGEADADDVPTLDVDADGTQRATWRGLTVSGPTRPVPFAW